MATQPLKTVWAVAAMVATAVLVLISLMYLKNSLVISWAAVAAGSVVAVVVRRAAMICASTWKSALKMPLTVKPIKSRYQHLLPVIRVVALVLNLVQAQRYVVPVAGTVKCVRTRASLWWNVRVLLVRALAGLSRTHVKCAAVLAE